MSGENGDSKHENSRPAQQQEEDDADALLASLEEEDDSVYRAQRFEELRTASGNPKSPATFATTKTAYVTLKSDDEALSFTTEHERAVVHFFHPDFARCSTMDAHCQQIAEKHIEQHEADVSFARVDVKDAPFVVEKLGVRVLPCVIGFVKGVVKGKITGFEGLCWDGKEGSLAVTRTLEESLVAWDVLRKRLLLGDHEDESESDDGRPQRGIGGRKQKIEDDDDDWD